jgi:hypothetical protein
MAANKEAELERISLQPRKRVNVFIVDPNFEMEVGAG